MGFIIIDKIKNNNKKIMIFVEGTILKPKHNNIFSKMNMTGYVPINNSIETIKKWQEEGYEIIYLTSLKSRKAMKMAQHLDELGYTGSMVEYRQKNQNYATLIKDELPDILIEDDCKSIGGMENTCYNLLDEKTKKYIKHIVVEEFGGIDNVKLY
jgi:ribonucleotide monophosphatase NagD (HAD superfamily)